MLGLAYAMAPQGGAQGQGGSGYAFIIMMAVIFGLFYLLILRPQQKEQKKAQEMLNNIQKGDRILTKGGIYGSVIQTKDDILLVKIADNVKVEIARSGVVSVLTEKAESESQSKS